MKSLSYFSVLTLLGWVIPVSCFATVVGVSIVEQPVNLGAKSDPARIPLGGVGVISNHGYGIHRIIGEARPCPDGAMRWEGGSELDQNLASVFGISVEAQDPTQIMAFPVILRVKSWKPPGYSPYTKDQVLAATLWCLLRSTPGTPETPLDVRVVAEGPDDKALEAKYSGSYATTPDNDGNVNSPAKVAGTILENDARGITWVTFPGITAQDPGISPNPGMIIMKAEGDGDSGWNILPVWGNGNGENDFLRLNFWSADMCYSSYRSRGIREANSFLEEGGVNEFEVSRGEKSDSVSLSYPRVEQATLAADILALVISTQPTESRPLTVTFILEETELARYPAFRSAAGWKETRHKGPNSHHVELNCEFAWNAAEQTLTKGSIPLVRLGNLGWINPNPEPEPADDEAAIQLAVMVQQRIKDGIHFGTLLAEKNMTADMLHESGLPREIGKAGYYEALATYSNGKILPDKPQGDPVKLGDDLLDQNHRAGWTIGLARGETITMEVRKAIEDAKLKFGE